MVLTARDNVGRRALQSSLWVLSNGDDLVLHRRVFSDAIVSIMLPVHHQHANRDLHVRDTKVSNVFNALRFFL